MKLVIMTVPIQELWVAGGQVKEKFAFHSLPSLSFQVCLLSIDFYFCSLSSPRSYHWS